MPRSFVVLSFVFAACLAAAQDQSKTPPDSDSDKIPVRNLPIDPAKLADAVRNSYYHPDSLAGLECAVTLDWSALLKAMKADPEPERMKIIDGLKVRSHATRNKETEVTFNWTGGDPPSGKDHIEGGIKQMVSGFYQMYWPMIAASSLPAGAVFSKIEPLEDGNTKAYTSGGGFTTEMVLDKDELPTHYSVENPAMTGTIDAHYTPSPKPVPGDLRRITELDVTQQMGTSTINVDVILDYQAVDEFFVPQHVTFDVVGAFSIGMDFSACSATKGAAAPDVKN